MLCNGELYAWGYNTNGLKGIGVNDSVLMALDTSTKINEISDVTQVSSGYLHTCAVKKNGELCCGGLNFYERLGIGNATVFYYKIRLTNCEMSA